MMNGGTPGRRDILDERRRPGLLCGVKLEAIKGSLPSRLARDEPVLSREPPRAHREEKRCGARDRCAVRLAASPPLPEHVQINTGATVQRPQSVRIENINGAPATSSDYAPILKEFGFIPHYRGLELRKRY